MEMAHNLGFKGSLKDQAAEQFKRLYKLFVSVDATQVEINPFGETPQGEGDTLLYWLTTMHYLWSCEIFFSSFFVYYPYFYYIQN